jgi:hypothetical protein
MRILLLGFVLASASVLAGNNAAWNNSGGSLSTSPITLNVQSTASSTYTVRVPQVGDIYVSQAGSDANSCTLVSEGGTGPCSKNISATTLAKLSAGKSLWLYDAGTYSFPTTAPSIPNVGGSSDSNRVQVAGYPGVTTAATLALGANPAYLYGTSVNYWTFANLSVTCDADCFVVGFSPSYDAKNATHINIIGVNFTQTNASSTADNAAAVRMHYSYNDVVGADYINIVKSTITGAGSGTHNNTSGIIVFRVRHLNVLGNKITNVQNPIYYKHNHQESSASNVDINFKNNMIQNGYTLTRFHVNFAKIVNNVFDSTVGLDFGDADGGQGGDDNLVANNTFRNTGLSMNWTNCSGTIGVVCSEGSLRSSIHDNVFFGTSSREDNRYSSNNGTGVDQQNTTNHNSYSASSSIIYRNGNSYTLSGYVAAFSGQEAASEQGTITFVGGASPSISSPSQWSLQSGSKGYGTGTGGLNTGVNTNKLLTVN